jgi:hypothetical protein
MSFINKIYHSSDFKFAIYVLYLVLLVLGVYHHEMWRDEYEEYLQARDAVGLFGLGNTMSQGHAMLWQGCLWIITRFTHNPIAMQVFHALIVACFGYVLLYKSPFKLWQAALLLFSYFFLFEYAVISRCYAFGVLFFMLFANNYAKDQQLNWKTGILLFLLANTSIYAMMLTSVLVFWLFFKDVIFDKLSWKEKFLKRAPILFLAGLGILLAYLQIRPQEDNSFPVNRVIWPFNDYRFDAAITQFFSAFVPIARFQQDFFWNTNFLMNDAGLVMWYWPFIVFVIVTLPFIRKYSVLLLWLGGIGLVLFFQYHTGFRFARYYGHFFIWWLLCMWLLHYYNSMDKAFNIVTISVFALVIVAQLIGGAMMYRADWNQNFSRGPEAANWLQKNGYANSYMIGTVDFAMSPIAAELDRKIYYMQHKSLCSFTKWDKKRLNSTTLQDWEEAIESSPDNKPVIIIVSHPVPEFEYFKAAKEHRKISRTVPFSKYKMTFLTYFKPGIEYYEGYWLFKLEK